MAPQRPSTITAFAWLVAPFLQLDIKSATLGNDEAWAPSVQATLVCALTDRALLTALDPLPGRTVEVQIDQHYGARDTAASLTAELVGQLSEYLSTMHTGEVANALTQARYHSYDESGGAYEPPTQLHSRLSLRRRRINYADGEVTIELASQETLLQDDAHISATPWTPPFTYLWEVVNYVLNRIGTEIDDMSSPARDTMLHPDLKVWQPGITSFEYLYSQVKAAGLSLWADGQSRWHLQDRRPVWEPPYALDTSVNVQDIADDISRDADWYTAAVLTYRWTDSVGVNRTQYDVHTLNAYPARVFTETYESPYPGPGQAAAFVAAFQRRARENTITAIADYSVFLGRTVNLTIFDGGTQMARTTAVKFEYPADIMIIRTNDLLQ
ncbi:hypothetical protein [Cryobacterium luteum]|uniref:Uncharacterized protein n=1 Tax=Cryobacterium luteum TaxID=1424661 RepID=A0A1H8ATY4_9MICO|nr:hypothetical protein [Cryobacterium luteum]TFB88612.1 hypothetical protein E3O10_12600 [Cryobacterium luteum]SEM73249.1 hypothetical protein SAMN05216281_101302 [Cryobacterium luteum]